ncbi:MAG TPA: hypothetical protein VD929_05830 [Caulobacteraceae bacterium]|nr:hypothetical protein [Caulobacteraceae bacterium]
MSHTEGHVEGTWFFDQEWDYAHNCYRYTLPESVREALQSEGLV